MSKKTNATASFSDTACRRKNEKIFLKRQHREQLLIFFLLRKLQAFPENLTARRIKNGRPEYKKYPSWRDNVVKIIEHIPLRKLCTAVLKNFSSSRKNIKKYIITSIVC
jgi:hypothetical protein